MAVLLFSFVVVLTALSPSQPREPTPTFSDFLTHVERGEVQDVLMRTRDNSMRVTLDQGRIYEIGFAPDSGNELIGKLRATGARVEIEPSGQRWWAIVLRLLIPVALLAGLWFFVLRRSIGSDRLGAFGRAPAKRVPQDAPKIGFDAVGGADEAVEELQEIVDFLRDPGEVPGARRADPEGRAALRASRHRQDAAGPRGRG